MIVVMKTDATEAQILGVQKHVRELGFKDHRIHGEERTVVAVLGHVYPELVDELGVIDGVDTVVRISKPFKLASREVNPYDTVVKVGHVEIGGGSVVVMGGPCSVDSEENVMETARAVQGRRRPHPARRRLQAAHQPLRLPRPRRERRCRSWPPPARRPACPSSRR